SWETLRAAARIRSAETLTSPAQGPQPPGPVVSNVREQSPRNTCSETGRRVRRSRRERKQYPSFAPAAVPGNTGHRWYPGNPDTAGSARATDRTRLPDLCDSSQKQSANDTSLSGDLW